MGQKFIIDPVTRIEGHLKIECEMDGGRITNAKCCSEMFRGWEIILQERSPLDAPHICSRICGVCPTAHTQAACHNLDNAFGINAPENGRLIRNLILGSNYLQSHILHFYHLAALDYVDITAILNYQGRDSGLIKVKNWAEKELKNNKIGGVSPFLPRYEGKDFYISDQDLNIAAISHYIQALDMRKKAQEALAIWGGKMPHVMTNVPGGVTEKPTADKVASFIWRMRELQGFIENVYIPDVLAVASAYSQYFTIGKGSGNLLSYGVFWEDLKGNNKLFSPGVYVDGKPDQLAPNKIKEYVKYSKYADQCGNKHPSDGLTVPTPQKAEAYTWSKTPRYDEKVVEVGPLARMAVTHLLGKNQQVSDLVNSTLQKFNAPVTALFSVLGRHAARALEAKVVVDRCIEWAMMLQPGQPVYTHYDIPNSATGMGLTEAPRGALGHWITIENKVIKNYQCVVPTTWNVSPLDDRGEHGPVEQALIGTPISDVNNPIEAVRVVRSFDPCIACTVHLITPDEKIRKFKIN
ncbi:MAG: nickel-dependent hydrogenase large subunit [bacterium]